jgi:lipoprotein-releasing system permease protein
MIRNGEQGTKVSKPIIRISIVSISLAIVVNLITVAIVTGFQNEIRTKITSFNAPLFISKAGSAGMYEGEPVHKNQPEVLALQKIEGVKSILNVAYKPALLQSDKFQDKIRLANGKDSLIARQEIAGILMKGVDENYDWEFIKSNLIAGKIPNLKGKSASNEILLSEKICDQLNFKLNDEIAAFYVKNQPLQRRYKIVGIFKTGLEEYDKKLVFCDLREVQRMNDYGLSSSIELADTLTPTGALVVKAEISGNKENLMFDWGKGIDLFSGFYMSVLKDTTLRLIVYEMDYNRNTSKALDTSYLQIKTSKVISSTQLLKDEEGNLVKAQIDEKSYFLTTGNQKIKITSKNGKGSSDQFVAGMEVHLKNWNDLDATKKAIETEILMHPTKQGELLQVTSILENESDLFAWLSFLDYNVMIIVLLMLVIGIINVGSALLVLIVMRTNFIGMLKSMGATNWSIRKIFLYQASYLILKGLLYGNIIGVSLCLIQEYFGIMSLDPSVYYLDKVPIELTFINWFIINMITFTVCIVSLIIPSYVVTRISPSKAIRFN